MSGTTYRSQYQRSKYSGFVHGKVLDVFTTLIFVSKAQGLTNDPRLYRLDVVRIIEHTAKLRILHIKHNEEADTSHCNEDADQNVPQLEDEKLLDIAPRLRFGAYLSMLVQVPRRLALFAAKCANVYEKAVPGRDGLDHETENGEDDEPDPECYKGGFLVR
jgi:hypothetical protein